MANELDQIAEKLILAVEASANDAWSSIKKSAPFFLHGYAATVLNVSRSLQDGSLSPSDAGEYLHNAKYLLVQGVANTSHAALIFVQSIIDAALASAKGYINGLLPVALF